VGRGGTPEDVSLALKFSVESDFFDGRVGDVAGGMSV